MRSSHTDAPRVSLDHAGNGEAMGNYTQWYEYDGVGNILEMRHQTNSGRWRRCYQYAEDSNRLLSTSGPDKHQDFDKHCATHYAAEAQCDDRYEYDQHGNMTKMPHLSLMAWDCEDQLHAIERGTPEAYYVYDAGGECAQSGREERLCPY